MKCKCGHDTDDYILCTARVSDVAEVDEDDPDYADTPDLFVDTGISLWMHVCRECNAILEAGIEDDGGILTA